MSTVVPLNNCLEHFTWSFGQPWLSCPEDRFNAGCVSIGFQDGEMVVQAQLEDCYVMTDVFSFNFPAFTQCDTFEMFLAPTDVTTYYEFHVTPSNSVLQLRFDDPDTKKAIENRMVAEPLFLSHTSVGTNIWNVTAHIPLRRLYSLPYREWQLSFGRYDYTPGHASPIISSTSPHTVCCFHRRHEWRTVRF